MEACSLDGDFAACSLEAGLAVWVLVAIAACSLEAGGGEGGWAGSLDDGGNSSLGVLGRGRGLAVWMPVAMEDWECWQLGCWWQG